MKFVTNSLPRAVISAFFILLLVGCGNGKGLANDPKTKMLNPEQAECIWQAENKRFTQAELFAKQKVDAMVKLHSTIELTIAERRMDEQICLEEAKCYGKDELIVSMMFGSCLDGIENYENKN